MSKESICDIPKYCTIPFTSSIIKLAYLKNPSNPRFPAKLVIKRIFFVLLFFELKIAFPK